MRDKWLDFGLGFILGYWIFSPFLERYMLCLLGKVSFTKQGGCLWYLGKDTVPGPRYGGYAGDVVVR